MMDAVKFFKRLSQVVRHVETETKSATFKVKHIPSLIPAVKYFLNECTHASWNASFDAIESQITLNCDGKVSLLFDFDYFLTMFGLEDTKKFKIEADSFTLRFRASRLSSAQLDYIASLFNRGSIFTDLSKSNVEKLLTYFITCRILTELRVVFFNRGNVAYQFVVELHTNESQPEIKRCQAAIMFTGDAPSIGDETAYECKFPTPQAARLFMMQKNISIIDTNRNYIAACVCSGSLGTLDASVGKICFLSNKNLDTLYIIQNELYAVVNIFDKNHFVFNERFDKKLCKLLDSARHVEHAFANDKLKLSITISDIFDKGAYLTLCKTVIPIQIDKAELILQFERDAPHSDYRCFSCKIVVTCVKESLSIIMMDKNYETVFDKASNCAVSKIKNFAAQFFS